MNWPELNAAAFDHIRDMVNLLEERLKKENGESAHRAIMPIRNMLFQANDFFGKLTQSRIKEGDNILNNIDFESEL